MPALGAKKSKAHVQGDNQIIDPEELSSPQLPSRINTDFTS
jgi:hypothetical protein